LAKSFEDFVLDTLPLACSVEDFFLLVFPPSLSFSLAFDLPSLPDFVVDFVVAL